MKRRELDGCPITGALQILGDKWTMLVVRELVTGPKRTMELLNSLFPISSRTLVGRLRDMEKDDFVRAHGLRRKPAAHRVCVDRARPVVVAAARVAAPTRTVIGL